MALLMSQDGTGAMKCRLLCGDLPVSKRNRAKLEGLGFAFSGRNSILEESFDNVYTLSPPGFVWHTATYTLQSPQEGHTCARDRSQILSIWWLGLNPEVTCW